MKYPSVIVTVPGMNKEELWLSLTEAKRLRTSLDKKIKEAQAEADSKRKKK